MVSASSRSPDGAPDPKLQSGAVPVFAREVPSRSGRRRALALAERLLFEQPELVVRPDFASLAFSTPTRSASETTPRPPSLVLDDFPVADRFGLSPGRLMYEHRARLRAGDGDLVASHHSPDPAVEQYFGRLHLGAPDWLITNRQSSLSRARLATRCWVDPATRSKLLEVLQDHGSLVIHPYQSNIGIWQLALLLEQTGRGRVSVLGPPPALAAAVNNKAWFSKIVGRLFDQRFLPPTQCATSLSTAALLVKRIAERTRKLVIKLPSGSGGLGNLVFDRDELGATLGGIRAQLRESLDEAGWSGEELLISGWESDVLAAPSIQLWIPAPTVGEPLVEGIFEQIVEGARGRFVGCRPTGIDSRLRQEIVDTGWQLGLLFQRLGYVGRCSFDYLVVAHQQEEPAIEILECNGRWGGTSIPMSLVHRLLGHSGATSFCARQFTAAGLVAGGLVPKHAAQAESRFLELESATILEHFEGELYDPETGSGWLVLANLGHRGLRPWVTVIGLSSKKETPRTESDELPEKLDRVVAGRLAALLRRR